MMVITPESFQSTALAWLGVVTVVSGAAIAAALTIWTKFADLRAKFAATKQKADDNAARLDDHSRRITASNQTVTEIAKAIVPNGNGKTA